MASEKQLYTVRVEDTKALEANTETTRSPAFPVSNWDIDPGLLTPRNPTLIVAKQPVQGGMAQLRRLLACVQNRASYLATRALQYLYLPKLKVFVLTGLL